MMSLDVKKWIQRISTKRKLLNIFDKNNKSHKREIVKYEHIICIPQLIC